MGWAISFKIKLIVFFSAIAVIILISFTGDYTNPRRAIYFHYNSKISFSFLFGYLPKDYFIEYTETIIEETENYRLINIIYNKFPSENHNYVLLQEKNEHGLEEILYNSDSIFWYIEDITDLLSSQIDLSVFNKYLKDKNLSEKEEVINCFCRFITDFGSSDYKIVHTAFEISELRKVKVFETSNFNECYKILKDGFVPDFENFTYIWFDDIGLFEISIVLDNGRLISIKDQFIFGVKALCIGTDNC